MGKVFNFGNPPGLREKSPPAMRLPAPLRQRTQLGQSLPNRIAINAPHSYRNASIGSSREAFHAG